TWPIGAEVEIYGARFGGSGWVICTSVPPGFWARAGALVNTIAARPHDASRLQRNIAMRGLLAGFATGLREIQRSSRPTVLVCPNSPIARGWSGLPTT